jgi:hypothetical protein
MSKLANQPPPSDMDVDSADAAEEKNLVRFSINGFNYLTPALARSSSSHPPDLALSSSQC